MPKDLGVKDRKEEKTVEFTSSCHDFLPYYDLLQFHFTLN